MKKHYFYSIILFILVFFSTNLIALNIQPVAVNDTITVNSGGSYTFSPITNDYDPDGDPFMIFSAGFKNNSGSIIVSSSSITLNMHYGSGIDTIVYFLRDSIGALSNQAYIFVTINPNHTSDTLNINNISAPFVPFGNAFWDFNSMMGSSHFQAPKGSGKTTIFTSLPWIGGKDQSNILHFAGETFRTRGVDYFYGPVCDTNTLSQYSDSLWNRVWKINKSEIDYHKNNYWKSSYAMPEAIANWPAEGDVQIGQNPIMAPYIDKNNDGDYVPSDGDYPKIRGDQSIFLIFNDNKNAHTESLGIPMGVEVHQWAYAYNCASDTALDHTIFIHYDIYNRSNNNYHDVYFGQFTDFDIGYAYDDYVGCDTNRNLFYGYNGLAVDGLGHLDHYGANPPAQGVVFLSEDMTSFMASYNTGVPGQSLDPSIDTGFYNFMQAIWADGSHLTFGGKGYQGTNPINFIYSGDPNDTITWSELHPGTGSGNIPYDRRGIGSIGPFNLAAGAVKSIDLAYVYARDTSKSNIENVTLLKYYTDKIQSYYDNDSTPCGGSFTAITKPTSVSNTLRIYPVPADKVVNIDYLPNTNSAIYEIYNISGQLIQSGKLVKKQINSLDIDNYKSGLYFVLIRDKSEIISRKFIVR